MGLLPILVLTLVSAVSVQSADQPKVSPISQCGPDTDLVLILDASGSQEDLFARQKEIVRQIAEALPKDSQRFRTSLIAISDAPIVHMSLAADAKENPLNLLEAMDKVKFLGGMTATAAAVRTAAGQFQQFARPDARHVVLLLTDGISQDETMDVIYARENLKNSTNSVIVLALSSSLEPNLDELAIYAGDVKNVFLALHQENFYKAIKDLAEDESSKDCALDLPEMSLNEDVENEVTTMKQDTELEPEMTTELPEDQEPPTTEIPPFKQEPEVEEPAVSQLMENETKSEESELADEEATSMLPEEQEEQPIEVTTMKQELDMETESPEQISSTELPAFKQEPEIDTVSQQPIIDVLMSEETEMDNEEPSTSEKPEPTDGPEADNADVTDANDIKKDSDMTEVPTEATTEKTEAPMSVTEPPQGASSTTEKQEELKISSEQPDQLTTEMEEETTQEPSSEPTPIILESIKATTNKTPDVAEKDMDGVEMTEFKKEAATDIIGLNKKTVDVPPVVDIRESGPCEVDLLFLLDTSTSVDDDFLKQRNFMLDLLDDLPSVDFLNRIRVAVISFSNSATLNKQLDSPMSKSDLIDLIKSIKHVGGGTSAGKALRMAESEVRRARRVNSLLIALHISDGNSQDPLDFVLRDAAQLRDAGAVIYAQTFSDKPYFLELNGITGDEDLVYADQNKNAKFFYDIKAVANSDKCFKGENKPKLQPRIRASTDRCLVDVFVMLDTSGSIKNEYFLERDFIVETFDQTTSAQYDAGNVAVSVVAFNSRAQVVLPFEVGRSKVEIEEKVHAIDFTGGGTSAVSAVTLTVEQINQFRRPKADLVVLLVGDGNSGLSDTFDRVQRAADALQATGASIYAVTFSKDYYLQELRTYTGSEKNVYAKERTAQFPVDFSSIVNVDEADCGIVVKPAVSKPTTTPSTPSTTSAEKIESASSTAPSISDLTESTESITEAVVSSTATPSNETCGKLDLMIVLDTSGSVTETFERERQLAADVLKQIPAEQFNTRVMVAAVSFSEASIVELEFSSESAKQTVVDKVMGIKQVGGKTSTVGGVRQAVKQMKNAMRKDARSVVILVTDGAGQDLWADVGLAAGELHATGALVYAVTMSNKYYLPELQLYAGNVQRVYTGDRIERFLAEMQRVMTEYNCADRGLSRRAILQPGSIVLQNCELVDLIFILDTSGSVKSDFLKERQTVINIIEKLNINALAKGQISVGLVRFFTSARIEIPLDVPQNKQMLLTQVGKIRHTGGGTSAVSGIEMALNMFRNSGRPSAQSIVVLITDGKSRDFFQTTSITAAALAATGATVYTSSQSRSYYLPELQLYASDNDKVFVDGQASVMEQVVVLQTETSTCQIRPETAVEDRVILPKLVPEEAEKEEEKQSSEEKIEEPASMEIEEEVEEKKPSSEEMFVDMPVLSFAVDAIKCSGGVDLVIILDTSGSISQVFNSELQFALRVVENLNEADVGPNIGIGLVTFAQYADVQIALNERRSKAEVLSTLRSTVYTGGSTDTSTAVRLAINQLDINRRSDRKQVVVLINDGHSQNSWFDVMRTAQQLQDTQAQTFAVSYSNNPYLPELSLYAGNSDDVYQQRSAEQLIIDLTRVISNAQSDCDKLAPEVVTQRPVTRPTPAPFTRVPLTRPPPVVTPVPQTQECVYDKIDLVVILDASSSVREVFEHQRELTLSLIERLPIDESNSQIAMSIISFTIESQLRAALETNQNKQDLRDAVNGIPYRGGSTHTTTGVKLAVTELQTRRRADALPVVVLMNDGQSQDIWREVLQTSMSLQNTGAERYVVALAPDVYMPELQLYSSSDERIYQKGETVQFLDEISALAEGSGRTACVTTGRPIPSPTQTPGECSKPDLDIILVADTAGTETGFDTNMGLLLDLMGSLPLPPESDQARFMMCDFDSRDARLSYTFSSEQTSRAVLNAVAKVKYTGRAGSLTDAVKTALNEWKLAGRSGAKPVFILAVNSQSYAFDSDQVNVVNELRDIGAMVHVVGFGLPSIPTAVAGFAESSSQVYSSRDVSKFLIMLRQLISEEICANGEVQATTPYKRELRRLDSKERSESRAVIKPISEEIIRPIATKTPAGTSESIPSTDSQSRSAARPESAIPDTSSSSPLTQTPTPDVQTSSKIPTGCKLDILFVLDASGSMNKTFQNSKQIAIEIVRDHLIVGPEHARVAVIRYAGPRKARTIMHFDTIYDSEDIIQQINDLEHLGGTTDTRGALALAAMNYDSARGARIGNAMPVVIIFTDGYSTRSHRAAAKALRKLVPTVLAVGVNKDEFKVNMDELVKIAGNEEDVYTDEHLQEFYERLDQLTDGCK